MSQVRIDTARKMKFSMKDFFSKCDQIRSLMENFIFCAGWNESRNCIDLKFLKVLCKLFQ